MATETGDYIVLTPTWRSVLPILLAANQNLERKLSAKGCNIDNYGWCDIHDSEQYGGKNYCELWSDSKAAAAWRKDKVEALESNNGELARMAKAADHYNELVPFIKKVADKLGTDDGFNSDGEALQAIFTKLADIAGID